MWKFSQRLMRDFVSSHYSPEQAAASSAATSSAGRQFALSNGRPTRQLYWSSDKTTDSYPHSQFGMTCKPLTAAVGEDVLTWFLEDFLVRTSVQPEPAPASPVRVRDFGVRWRGLFTKYNHDSHMWKTRPSLWGEGLMSSLPTLPRWGLMHDGALWERVTLVRRINETESGSLPTPVAYDSTATSPGNHYKGLGWRSKHDAAALVGDRKLTAGGESLTANSDVVRKVIYPTPLFSDGRAATDATKVIQEGVLAGTVQDNLRRRIRREEMLQTGELPARKVWPTPTVTQVRVADLEGRMERRPGATAVPLIERLMRDDVERKRASLYPTPVANEEESTRRFNVETTFKHFVEGSHQVHLAQMARDPRLFPTPTATNGLRNGGGGGPTDGTEHHPGKWQHPGHPEYGELSPEWVEWLMGWPQGWTNTKPMNAAAFKEWQDDNGETDRGGDHWAEDPSDSPNGIGKTVPKAKHRWQEDLRVARISALGNGQVSAACAAAFIHLWHLELPAETKETK